MKRAPKLILVIPALLLATGSVASQPASAQDIAMSDDEAQAIEHALGTALDALKAQRFDEAIGLLEPLSRRPDAPPQIKALLGAAYVESERPQQALAVLEPLIEANGDDPAVLFNAARAALDVGRTADGERYLEHAATLAPSSPAARLLGLIRGRQGRVLDAYRLLRPLALANPSDTEVRIAAAASAVRLQRATEAEQLLSDLSQKDPRVRVLWGRLLFLRGEPQEALAMMQPLADADLPEALRTDARLLLADIQLELGNASAARALLGDLTQNPMTAFKLSQAEYQSGDVSAAIATLEPFRAPLLADPGEDLSASARRLRASLAGELGRYLLAAGRHADAVPLLEVATRLNPELKQAWQSLGQALAATGERQRAEQALDHFRTLAAADGSVTTQQNRAEQDLEDATGRELRKADQLVGAGRFEAALGMVRTELALAPDDPRPRLAESRILLLLGRHDEALAAVERALGKVPGSADAWYQRGAVRLAMRAFDGAEADLRHALEINDQHTAAMNDLAVLLIVRGQRQEARTLLQHVLELNPNDRGAAQNLERLNKGRNNNNDM